MAVDLAEYFKSGVSFQDLFKQNNFGNILLPKNTTQRAEVLTKHRRVTRGDTLLKRRNISMSKMSPYNTPNKKKPEEDTQIVEARRERLEKLERWRQRKFAKEQAEKGKKKPPFRVGIASAASVSNDVLKMDISRQIKLNTTTTAKFIVPETRTVRLRNAKKGEAENTVNKSNKTKQVTDNNRKASKLSVSSGSSVASEASTSVQQIHRYSTRSQTKALESKTAKQKKAEVREISNKIKKPAAPQEPKENIKQKVPVKKPENETKVTKQSAKQRTPAKKKENNKTNTARQDIKQKTPTKTNKKETIEIASTSEDNPEDFVTPVKEERPVLADITPEKNTSPVYISPFVTISRGKNSARKEYHERRSLSNSQDGYQKNDTAACITPKAGALYFMKILNNNIERIQGICKEWEDYKNETSPPEEACDMINVAIGQSQLLINKKFEQFRSLINQCINKDSDALVTCEDLHGFWDLVYIQVVNLDKRFDNLVKLKENNWQEVIPEKKIVTKVKKVAKKETAKPASKLKLLIKERKKAVQQQKVQENDAIYTFNGGFFSVNSPVRDKTETKATPRRSSRKRFSSLNTDLNNSPGMKILRASMGVKKVVEGKTPNTKGILKSDSAVTSERKKVLFKDDQTETGDNEVTEKTFRRSRRLSKLF